MTDRNTIIHECIAALPDAPWGSQAHDYSVNAEAALRALLSVPDQAKASEPSQSADVLTAPVDHGPAADGEGEAGMSQCTTCGERYRTAPPGYIHKCGKCRGMCRPITAAQPDDWTPDERTVRFCIEKLPHGNVGDADPAWMTGVNSCHAILQSLLPKPDPVAALVKAFYEHDEQDDETPYTMPERVLRWLVSEGRLTL